MGSPAPLSTTAVNRRQKLQELVHALEFLPTSAAVPMRVLKLKQSGSAGMADIADALSADTGLVAKILSLVNSAAFSPVNKVTRLSQATAMIGMRNLMPLVFGLTMTGMFNRLSLGSEDRAALFQSSLLKASAARAVAAIAAPDLQEEAFLCGLLQDIALPAILAADKAMQYDATNILEIQNPVERQQREMLCYGTDHAALGSEIIKRLGLPALYEQAIALHHAGVAALTGGLGSEAAGLGSSAAGLARAIDVAASLPHRPKAAAGAVQSVSMKLRAVVQDDPARAAELSKGITAAFKDLTQMFGESEESSGDHRTFLHQIAAEVARTTEAAVEASQAVIVDLQAQHTKLVQEVEELRQHVARAEIDELTGIFTRGAFMRRVTMLLQAARTKGIECYVGYADIDNFKSVNDTWGHALGDEAIREVASRLSAIVRRRGLVARMGGDEFAFILLRRPSEDSLQEETRLLSQRLASFTLTAADATVPIGASTGLFYFGVPTESDTADSLLARADQAMYAVKRSGKGRCVTVSGVESEMFAVIGNGETHETVS